MGNIASQDNSRSIDQIPTRSTRLINNHHTSDTSHEQGEGLGDDIKKTSFQQRKVKNNKNNNSSPIPTPLKTHPLLSPSKENRYSNPISCSSNTIMGHNKEGSSNPITQHGENSQSTQDVTMSDSGASNVNLNSQPSVMNIDNELNTETESQQQSQSQSQNQEEEHHPPPRRRSTMILTDDPEFEKLRSNRHDKNEFTSTPDINNKESISEVEEHNNSQDSQHNNNTVPFEIVWVQGGENVFITGSFTGWSKMIKLTKESDDKFSIKLKLPVGTHRFRFIVDNELRFSDYLPTATDQMGNFVNYIEIQQPDVQMTQDDQQQISHESHEQGDYHKGETQEERRDSALGLTNDDDDMGNGYSRFHGENQLKPKLNYIRDIPAIFTDPSVMEQYYLTLDNNAQNNQNQSWLTPPQLPPHLESVILNNFSTTDKSNSSGALPIPNHVVLNHLATTSIKHNTLAVASVVRYKRKYATQVLYAPLQ